MKEHRWVAIIHVPVKLMKNEDQDWYISHAPNKQNIGHHPMQIVCYDCQKLPEKVFGEPCEGFLSTGVIDETAPNKLWEEIP